MPLNNFFMALAELKYLEPPPEPKVFTKCCHCNMDIYLFEYENGTCQISENGVLCERCKRKQ